MYRYAYVSMYRHAYVQNHAKHEWLRDLYDIGNADEMCQDPEHKNPRAASRGLARPRAASRGLPRTSADFRKLKQKTMDIKIMQKPLPTEGFEHHTESAENIYKRL